MPLSLLITCEHGGYRVPAAYAAYFRGQQRVLRSHRGHDPGALQLARRLARQLDAPLYASTISRLLVELNRSTHHRQLFSEFTRPLTADQRREILQRYYTPHRRRITDWLQQYTSRSTVVHISVHSFTPELQGVARRADVGLLYDPRRLGEMTFCQDWQRRLRQQRPDLRVRRNYPYLGRADGLTTALRRQFADPRYLGIELEVNQSWVEWGGRGWRELQADLVRTLAEVQAELNAAELMP
jgi:predicted N-formylglutamate amidohydrolase